MTPDRESRIERICQAALEREGPGRAAFLDEACAGDATLQRDVESLLAQESQAAGFLSTPAAALGPGSTGDSTSFIGRQLGPYIIQARLGAGGMGEVYRAHDTKLGRGPSSFAQNVTERYRVGRELARGGMGSIHEAEDLHLSRTVAIKQLLVAGADAKARFEREALITARLQHPAVIPVFDFGELPASGPYYAMKLVAGRSLDRAIDEAESLEERLALLPHMMAAIDAIAFAHSRGIVHRDLKPHNVLVGAFGETVVIDWGLAKDLETADDSPPPDVVLSDQNLTQVGMIMGTPAYMPPEQAEGAAVDTRADVYALGAMLYHLLAGRPPYAGLIGARVLAEVVAQPPVPLLQSAPGLPVDIATIIEKAMARKPTDRYPSALEMAEDMRRFQTGQLVGAHRYTAWQLVRHLVGKNPLAVALGAVVTVAFLFGLALLAVQEVRVREGRETKRVTDAEISALETAIDGQPDPAELRRLEQQLEAAVGRARRAAEQFAKSGAQVVLADDDMDLRIHGVLARLDADTYSIPHQFRRAVFDSMDRAKRGEMLDRIRQSKRKLWPIIARELDAFGLPEDLGYLAWLESEMDPSAESPTGSIGLWQFDRKTARAYGLRVDVAVDERADPVKSSHAAAQMLADLFAEFGGDATPIAVVAYNLGEPKMRALLHEIAMEKGSWRSGQRSYWHLYRLRRLPQEAQGYLPQFVAAALLDRSIP